jgi:hypothetical protein
MTRFSQFDSAQLTEGGRVRVAGPTGGAALGEFRQGRPVKVHFAIVREGQVITGTGSGYDDWRWSGQSDEPVLGMTAGPASAYALEVRFLHDPEDDDSSGGFEAFGWSQEIELE